MTNPMLEKLVRFQRTENALPFAQNLNAHTLAALFGAEEPEYRSVIEDLDRQRLEATARVAAGTSVDTYLQTLPFAKNAHLVAIGESTTADRLSWFEILRTLLEARRPDLQLRFTNLAVSGATTTQILAILPTIQRHEPDWLFCMLGANDSQRFNAPNGPLLVSSAETRRNLYELRTRALPNDDAKWVWLTPTPVDEERVARFPFFTSAGIGWKNEDLDQLSQELPSRNDVVIDSSTAVRLDDSSSLSDDGLHPSVATHETLATKVLEELTKEGR